MDISIPCIGQITEYGELERSVFDERVHFMFTSRDNYIHNMQVSNMGVRRVSMETLFL